MELGSHSWMGCLAAKLFIDSCFSDAVFVTLFRTAVETAISGVHKLLRIGGVPTSLTERRSWALIVGWILGCLAAQLFVNSCFSDTVTLFRTAVQTAVS